MKNIIVITGGAGFIGSNLIELLLKKTKKFKFISLDDYSSGKKNNHIKNPRVKYIKGSTINIKKHLLKYQKQIHSLFHFGEFARIYQSFKYYDECFKSNSIGTNEVLKFCLDFKIKLIYSATSASLGNSGDDKNLSPYAFSKAKNLELLENLKKWFNFKFEVIYFYNVYGPKQIRSGPMATVIGIFEKKFENNKRMPVVSPGTQSRRFTHVLDTVQICYEAWKKNKCRHYSISNTNSYSIIQVAKMFKSSIVFLKPRSGERYASALTKFSYKNKVISRFGKIKLQDYITSFIKGSKL